MMEDRAALLPPMGAGEFVTDENMRASTTVAPPRARQSIIEEYQRFTAAPPVDYERETVGYKATGEDGITASPRVRQKLDDQPIGLDVYEVR